MIQDWMEKGQAPDQLTMTHYVNGKEDRKVLVCQYPQMASYKGSGDITIRPTTLAGRVSYRSLKIGSMADPRKRLPNNALGEFFVDSTCINCDTCRQLATATFDEAGDASFVRLQPQEIVERQKAFRALVACPVGAIGSGDSAGARAAVHDSRCELKRRCFIAA